MKFLIQDDLVIGTGTGDIVGIEAGPFTGVDPERLRFDGANIIDVSGRTNWYIDEHGQRHIKAAPGRRALSCSLSDQIERYGSGWRVVDPRTALLAHAQNRRKQVEIGGFGWNGLLLGSDDTSQIKTAGARIKAMADPGFETTWYGADGEGVVVDAALIIAMSDALLDHIDQSFTTFGLVKAGIDSGAVTTTAEIDAAFA